MIRPVLKYAATQWWLRRHTPRDVDQVIDFRKALVAVRRILVHLPSGFSEENLRMVHEKIIAFFPQCTIDYLLARTFPDDHRAFLKTTLHADEVLSVDDRDARWLPFLAAEKLGRLRRKEFDMVLDFGTNFDITAAHALHASGARIIAGPCYGNIPDGLHNLQVKVRTPESFPTSLFDILSRLRS